MWRQEEKTCRSPSWVRPACCSVWCCACLSISHCPPPFCPGRQACDVISLISAASERSSRELVPAVRPPPPLPPPRFPNSAVWQWETLNIGNSSASAPLLLLAVPGVQGQLYELILHCGKACVLYLQHSLHQSCHWEETEQTKEVKMINDPRPGPFPHVYVLKCCRQSLHYKIVIFHCTMRCSMTFLLSGLYKCFLLICKEPNRTDEEWYSVLYGGGAREHGGRKPPPLWERQKPENLWIAQRVGSSSLCVLSVHQSKCPIPSHSISLCIVCVYVCAFEWEQFISGTNISPRHGF